MPDHKDPTAELNQALVSSLVTRYERLANTVRELAAPLSDEQFWEKPFPFGNSVGHLVLHLTGNLNYYVGAQIAGTGYVRNRPVEFTETSRQSKQEVLDKFDGAVAIVLQTISAQAPEQWAVPYSGAGSDAKTRFDMVLQCATHLHHHVGQMMYLAFELKRDS